MRLRTLPTLDPTPITKTQPCFFFFLFSFVSLFFSFVTFLIDGHWQASSQRRLFSSPALEALD
jgi:hypothetical protein